MKIENKPIPLSGTSLEKGRNSTSFAFTLVELIVVITILAILATIAFLSFQNISSSARDSSRLSDVANIKKVLELGNATNGGFPMPDSSTGITRSGSVAWYQGTMGDTAVQQLKKLSKAPIDPLLKSPYTYSVTNSLKEYQIGYALENSVSMKNHPQSLLSKEGSNSVPLLTKEGLGVVFADTSSLLGYTDGNYNGLMIKVSTGALDYYLAVPSIVSSDMTKTNLVNQTGSLVFRGKKSLPSNTAQAFFGTNKTDTGVVFNPNSFVIYSTGAGNSPDTTLFMSGLKNVYTGSTMTNLSDTNLTNSVNSIINNTNSLASVLGKVGTAVNVSSNSSTTPVNASTLGVVDIFKDNSGKALYKFDGDTSDASGVYNGTANGTITYTTGKFGNAATFGTTSSNISIPSSVTNTSNMTFSLWVKVNSLNIGQDLAYIGGAYVYHHADGILRWSKGGTSGLRLTGGQLAVNTWTHLILTWNGTTCNTYINGILLGTCTTPAGDSTNITSILGASSQVNNYINVGDQIDQVRVFSKSLSPTEVAQLATEQ